MKRKIIFCIGVFLYYFFRIFPVRKNKIYIQSFNGKGYGDSPKYIVEEILRRGLNLKLIWAVRPEFAGNFPQAVKTVPFRSIHAIYEAATAKIWIDNCRKQLFVKKRKTQFYIQAWHGTLGIKKAEKDVEHQLTAFYVKHAKYDSTLADLFLSDSKFISGLFRSSFWYNGEILEYGSPKDDILINPSRNVNDKVKKYFNITDETKIILYAPTFRNDSDVDAYNINYEQILSNMREQTNESWVFLIRLHPNVCKQSKYLVYNDAIFNASTYDDMQELLVAGDILITDYSSCAYGFALMNKPVFLYINDYDQYINERDFYFDLFSLPFPCAVNSDELVNRMSYFNTPLYHNRLEDFFMKTGFFKNGNASGKVVDRIIAEMER